MGVQKETSLVYWLRDETGTVLARQYVVDPSDPVGVMWGYDSHDMDRGSGYVHVIGNLFTSAGGYSITIHRILPVNSVDSIVHHTMKVIQTFLTFGKQFVGTLRRALQVWSDAGERGDSSAADAATRNSPRCSLGVDSDCSSRVRDHGGSGQVVQEDHLNRRPALLRMENEKKVSMVDADTFVSNFTF